MPAPFDTTNPLMGNPLLQPAGLQQAIRDFGVEAGVLQSESEEKLEGTIRARAKKNKSTPWLEAVKLRRAAGDEEGKFISGSEDLKNLEHRFYAKEFSALGPRDTASNWIGSFAHPALKALGLRGKANREGTIREVVTGLQGTVEGAGDFVRAQFGLDPL